MTIEHIKGNSYIPKPSGKSESSSKINRTKEHSKTNDSANTSKSATQLSLSGSKFADEATLAKSVLDNMRQGSLDSLKKIKQNIASGTYDNESVQNKVSSLVKNDIFSFQSILSPPAEDKNDVPAISDIHKKHLLENTEVIKKVSSKVAEDLERM
jgi:anti-sigma28 factor (negative regulator of flagellin synthesis)